MLALALVCAARLASSSEAAPAPSAFPHSGPAMSRFDSLLDRRIALGSPTDREKLDAEIRREYERPIAVMITDLSGMTAITKRSGIIGFLALVRGVQRVAEPLVRAHGATWVKNEADDLFVVHESPAKLYALAVDLRAAVTRYAAERNEPISIAIGLSTGHVLVIGGEEIWGDPVNIASKLGEDAASGGEILASAEFQAALAAAGKADGCKPVEGTDRKANFPYFRCAAAPP